MAAISDKDSEVLNSGTDRMNRIRYMNFIIYEFASGFKRPLQEAFIYLEDYGGLKFLLDNYDYEHTQSEFNTCMHLLHVCRRNGGWL
ncbi:MAG: DUF3791 domain-containing protein [Dysgonamonadaceae bacterium]|jgi:hypothetical protein|nr:DUF3791 domain-containing protein [Dysgonamonadaceae bacterium]